MSSRNSYFRRDSYRAWFGVTGSICRSLDWREGGVFDAETDRRLPDALAPFVCDGWELVIEFSSEGYYDPGNFGSNETAYPPEGSDERTVTSIEVDGHPVPRELWGAIEEIYQAEIDKAELECEE